MSAGLAVFVKTPNYSPIKTRLAAECGRHYAEHWHRHAAAAVCSVAVSWQANGHGCAYWAVAETAAMTEQTWPGLPCVAQGDGDLGERLDKVYAELLALHDSALMIGADSPQLTAELLVAASAHLQSSAPRFVIGLSEDGGYWLIGGNRRLPRELWTSIRYSCADTGAETVRALVGHGDLLHLPRLRDVDHADDLAPMMALLHELTRPTPEQIALLNWMRAHPRAMMD